MPDQTKRRAAPRLLRAAARRTRTPSGAILTAALALIVATLTLTPAAAATTSGAHGSDDDGGGSLALTIDGLPTRVEAHITVRAPKYKEIAEKTRTFHHIPPGTYTITAPPVIFRDAMYGVAKGSTAYANKPVTTVTVTNGATSTATVTYGTIVDSHVVVLTASVLAVTGGVPEDPTGITVPSDRKYTVGQILTQAYPPPPPPLLPIGLFHRVTGVRVTGSTTQLTLVAAHLDEAFPQSDIPDTSIDLTAPVTLTAPQTQTQTTRTAATPAPQPPWRRRTPSRRSRSATDRITGVARHRWRH